MIEIIWKTKEDISEEKKLEVKKNINIVFNDYIAETGEDKSIIFKFDTIITDEKEKIKDLNGITIIPKNEGDMFHVLINMKQVNEYSDYAYTFPHELTHVLDYSKHMFDKNVRTEKELIASGNYFPIYYWSEFHARYYSFKYAVKYFCKSNEEILKEIIEPGFNQYMDDLKNHMLNDKNGGVEILTQLMYQYGRFIAFKEYDFKGIDQKTFPRDIIQDMLGEAGIDIYYLFENILNYEEFKKNYNEIVLILERVRDSFNDFRDRYNKIKIK